MAAALRRFLLAGAGWLLLAIPAAEASGRADVHRPARHGAWVHKAAPRAVRPAAARPRPHAHPAPRRAARLSRPPVRKAAARSRASRPSPARYRPLIMIDAGHGGRDSGSVGAGGLQEKTVALATAMELRRGLLATGRFRVRLTRGNDRFVSLADRVAATRSADPDLFVSIHADASPDRRARGASVYVRAGGGVRRLAAERANAGAIGRALGEAAVPRASALLQQAMVGQLQDATMMTGAPAREAHLYVLGVSGVPSVLVEVGFLSNRREEALLRSRRHRRGVAEAIGDAIADYFTLAGRPGAPT